MSIVLQQLIEAFDDYACAKSEEDSARADYDGYSWDYVGADYRERREKAAKFAEELLSQFIDERIAKALNGDNK